MDDDPCTTKGRGTVPHDDLDPNWGRGRTRTDVRRLTDYLEKKEKKSIEAVLSEKRVEK